MKEVEQSATFDECDNIIFSVYEWKYCKETYEELCNMPFDAFCKLFERANMHRAFEVERSNEEHAKIMASKRK